MANTDAESRLWTIDLRLWTAARSRRRKEMDLVSALHILQSV